MFLLPEELCSFIYSFPFILTHIPRNIHIYFSWLWMGYFSHPHFFRILFPSLWLIFIDKSQRQVHTCILPLTPPGNPFPCCWFTPADVLRVCHCFPDIMTERSQISFAKVREASSWVREKNVAKFVCLERSFSVERLSVSVFQRYSPSSFHTSLTAPLKKY